MISTDENIKTRAAIEYLRPMARVNRIGPSLFYRVLSKAQVWAALSMLVFVFPTWAEPVGKVLVVSGGVRAQGVVGKLRPLVNGSVVERGDTLITSADGNVQIRFVDDSLLMVRPSSRIRIDDYRAEGNALRSVMSLIAGSIRALTGRIAKTRRDAYIMATPTATIGVRGTDYELRLCQGDCPAGLADGLYLGVTEGAIMARNKAGSFELKAHQFGLIRDQESALEMLDRPFEAMILAPRATGKVLGTEPADLFRAGEDIAPSILDRTWCATSSPVCDPRILVACIPLPVCP